MDNSNTKKNYKDVIGSALLLAFFGSFYVMAQQVNKKCRTYPSLICVTGLILVAFNLGRALYRLKKNKPADVSSPMNAEQLIGCVITVAAAFLYAYLTKIIGYIVTTSVFIALFSVYLSYRSKVWSKKWTYPAVAVGTALGLYFIFKFFLNVPLPKGFLI